ncbi:23S rRNA (uracil(1939)-C(5))-methyltransferase RlmD [Helicovermis profundi]|uniref:23S rRNA (Uracil(1939)-C(5))-methyltransferase RlmD n=1 Tax=Helicovermis profundi TaxID=3065157 RepID=A0AAU9E789_9FIRM|nr:23S rRNA (uracil(1939)-C(5))-methyltransferase RlmD [Clostridia bacterium S502]
MNKNLEVGHEIEITINDLIDSGEGIGKLNEFAVFVEGAVPGDTIKCKITSVKKTYAYGELIEIINSSEIRDTPKCQYFNECGGCQMQNVKYQEQLKLKEKSVKDALKRIGEFKDIKIKAIVGMKENFRYRNKASYAISEVNGEVRIGFKKRNSHDVIDIEDCLLQDKEYVNIFKAIKKYIADFKVTIYNVETHKGLLRHVVIKKSFSENTLMVILVTNRSKLVMTKALAKGIVESDNRVVSVIQNINKVVGSKILGNDNKILFGDDHIVDKISGMKFKISPLSFFQVNSSQAEVLYEKAIEYADLKGEETVFDLYSGIGSIGMLMAKKAKKVYGVESVKSAVIDAWGNAKLNDIANIEFITGRAEKVIPKLFNKGEGVKADVVVVDPPRKGCDKELLDTMIMMEPERIVYVSCKASTLARDLRILCDNGYKLVDVTPVDMFPHTMNVESVSKLVRK